MRHLKTILALLVMVCIQARATYTVTFTVTNSLGQPDTNAIKLYPVSGPTAQGGYVTVGIPVLVRLDTNGYAATNLTAGSYLATNSVLSNLYRGPGSPGTTQGIIFAVPQGTGTNSFDRLALSGYNVYNYTPGVLAVVGTNGITVSNYSGIVTLDGSGFAPTLAQITNSLGFYPAASSVNLSNWSITATSTIPNNARLIATNDALEAKLQRGSDNLTNWSQISTGVLSTLQVTNANLNGWALTTTSSMASVTRLIATNDAIIAKVQPADSDLTNWAQISTNVFDSLQHGSLNLSNFSQLATNSVAFKTDITYSNNALLVIVQPASQNLTNWAQLQTNILATLQHGTANLTNWTAITTNILTTFQPTNYHLTVLSIDDGSNLTNLLNANDVVASNGITMLRVTNAQHKITSYISAVGSDGISTNSGTGTNNVFTSAALKNSLGNDVFQTSGLFTQLRSGSGARGIRLKGDTGITEFFNNLDDVLIGEFWTDHSLYLMYPPVFDGSTVTNISTNNIPGLSIDIASKADTNGANIFNPTIRDPQGNTKLAVGAGALGGLDGGAYDYVQLKVNGVNVLLADYNVAGNGTFAYLKEPGASTYQMILSNSVVNVISDQTNLGNIYIPGNNKAFIQTGGGTAAQFKGALKFTSNGSINDSNAITRISIYPGAYTSINSTSGLPKFVVDQDGITYASNSIVINGDATQYGTNLTATNVTANFKVIQVVRGDGVAVQQFTTTSDLLAGGVTIDSSGNVVATSFAGNGASVTSINATNITAGTIGTARLGSGSASSSTFLRGDSTWAVPPGSGGYATNAWNLTGNTATTDGTSFIGSSDNVNVSLRANNTNVAKFYTNGSAYIGALSPTMGTNQPASIIAGGIGNSILDAGGSGQQNAIVGGINNTIYPGGYGTGMGIYSAYTSTISNKANWAVIVGGTNNNIIGGTGSAVIDYGAAIVGGAGNTIESNSTYSAIIGGSVNRVRGIGAYALGNQAFATNDGSFVFSDRTGAFGSSSSNQFIIKASGGVGINTTNPQANIDVLGSAKVTTLSLSNISGGQIPYLNTDNTITNLIVGANLTLVGGTLSATGGGGSQTPWTSDINGATFSLTNLGYVLQTNAGIRQVVKRASATTASHTYDAMQFHYGNLTTNAYWGITVGSQTNTKATAAGDYDSLLTFGFNSPSSTNYNGNVPTLTFGMEDNYLASGIRQGELYLNYRVSSNALAIAPRPWGWSLKTDDGAGKPYIFHNWNIQQFEMNASNQLAAISFNQSGTNSVIETIARDSQLSLQGNTRSDGQPFIGTNGANVFGYQLEGINQIGSLAGTSAKAIMLGGSLNAANGYWLMGSGTSLTGLRWNNTSNQLEYCTVAGLSAIGTVTNNANWRPFNDFTAGYKSFYQAWVLSATTADTRELGIYTNNSFQGNALILVDIADANNAGTLRFKVPFNKVDCQDTTHWYEVLPDFTASDTASNRIAVDIIGLALDSCKLRVRQLGSQAETLRINIQVIGDSGSVWSNTSTTASSGTTSGYYRHSAISTLLGNVGIGTNNPTAKLHVYGTASVSGNITNSALTASRIVFTDPNKALSSATASGAVPINADGTASTAAQIQTLTEAIEYPTYSGGTNITIDFSKAGGRLSLTTNTYISAISNLSSNSQYHVYRLTVRNSGTFVVSWNTNLCYWQGGTNNIIPNTQVANAEDSYALTTSYSGTNVYVYGGFNFKP